MEANLVIARGARRAEEALVSAALEHCAEARREPALLARPVRIVVPSRSLREHVASRLVERAGRSLTGIVVHTLQGLAFEALRRSSGAATAGDVLFPVVVRREARREPVLRNALEHLRDGYGAVTATVSDLLDAGLEPVHAEALDDCLRAQGDAGDVARARALGRVTLRTLEALGAAGLEHHSALYRGARECLLHDPEGALPARALLVHGFADVTGVQLELLEALVRMGAIVFVDHPPNPADPDRPDAGIAYTGRLVERLSALGSAEALPGTSSPVSLGLVRAPGAHAEVRAVGNRIRALLDDGVTPESIGVVAREIEPYKQALRVQLARLAVPFSGGPGSPGYLEPAARHFHALIELLQEGESTPTDRWLDVLAPRSGDPTRARVVRADLRVGLQSLGTGRLRDVAALDLKAAGLEDRGLALPVRRQLELFEPAAEGEKAPRRVLRARSRRLDADLLERTAQAARASLRRLRQWRAEVPEVHALCLEQLLHDDLGWPREAPQVALLPGLARAIAAELPAAFDLEREEFTILLDAALRGRGRDALGGAGGGVAVLSVLEARARTFEHLFVLGVNRDLFPRRVSEDPLLPDRLRRAIADVIPDVPIKARGFDEERYLFAQLCSASPHVTLSWQAVSDDGKEKTPSPLVERVRIADRAGATEHAPAIHDPRGPKERRSALEHAVLAGLHGPRSGLPSVLAVALGDASDDPASLARVRGAILEELDPATGVGRELGPYHGFVGTHAEPGDALYVTRVEALARCPWRTHLERTLRLEPVPDALEKLPSASPLLVGNLVHRVLDRVVAEAIGVSGGALEDVRRRTPVDVPWPSETKLAALLEDEAPAVLREAGIARAGFARVLTTKARPFLDRAVELDGVRGCLPSVLGAEVEGALEISRPAGGARTLRFRADRVDSHAEGLLLTDYKAGQLYSRAASRPGRQKEFLAKVECGVLLQGAAYSAAGGATGRYLYLRPDLDPDLVSRRVEPDDEEVSERFGNAVGTVLDALDLGTLPPRLVGLDGDEPRYCDSCDVAIACLRGDSGARRRLRRFVDGAVEPLAEAERTWLSLWMLGAATR